MPNSDGTMTRYEYRRTQQRCVKCNTRDARTMSGKSRCAECAEKASESTRKYYQNHRDHVMLYKSERYQTMRETGICPRCNKRRPESGRALCQYCLADYRRAGRARRLLQGAVSDDMVGVLGLCWRCRKNSAAEGSRYCVECLEWWESVRNKSRVENEFTQGIDAYWAERKGGGTNGEV